MDSIAPVVLAALAFVLIALFLSARVVKPYERMVIFRLGRTGPDLVREPGLRFLLPVIDRPVMVDIREKFIEVSEKATAKDNAQISIDTRIYWQIVDPLRSVLNVHSFADALEEIAAIALRKVVGDMLLDDVLSTNNRIGDSLRANLDEQTKSWGGTITTVEMRDIVSRRETPTATQKGTS